MRAFKKLRLFVSDMLDMKCSPRRIPKNLISPLQTRIVQMATVRRKETYAQINAVVGFIFAKQTTCYVKLRAKTAF